MAERLTITVADKVIEDINEGMKKEEKTNKSEYVEELIRVGLIEHQKRRTKENGHNIFT